MAQVTYQAAGTGSQAYGNLTPAYPTGLAANDLILLHVALNNLTSTPTTPTGFTLLFGPHAESEARNWIYSKISTGSESGTITVTISGSPNSVARMYSFRNNATTSFTEGGGFGSGTVSPVSMQSVTTTVAETLAVSFIHINDSTAIGASTGETGGDWVEAVAEFSGGSAYQNLQLQIATMASAGTISGGSFAAGGDTTSWGNRAFAIKPAGAPSVSIPVMMKYYRSRRI